MDKKITESITPDQAVRNFTEGQCLGPLNEDELELVELLKPLLDMPLYKSTDSFNNILPLVYNGTVMSIFFDAKLTPKFKDLSQKKLTSLIIYAYLDMASPEQKEFYINFFGIEGLKVYSETAVPEEA